jgi:hypothetical protein
VIDESPSIQLEAFEQIEAVPGRVLLRVTARAPAELSEGSLTLVVTEPATVHRLTPLPSPRDPSGLMRVAFPASAELLERAAEYQLELPDGSIVELPAPTQGTRRVSRAGALTAAIAELESTLEAERERRVTAEAQAEAAAQATTEALARLVEREAEQLAARRAEAELHTHLDHEAQVRRELEERLGDAIGQLSTMTVARLEAEGAVQRLAVELEQGRVEAAETAEQHRVALERANADALEVARNFELEAAEREEVQRLAERLAAEQLSPGPEVGVEIEALRGMLQAATDAERQARAELELAQADAEAASTLAAQWQAEAERAQDSAGRALEEVQGLRDVAAQADEPDDFALAADEPADPEPDSPREDDPGAEPEPERRFAAERALAQRQAANREVLRRAREREQAGRRGTRRKPGTPKPPGPEQPRGGRPGERGSGHVEARASAPRVSRAAAPRATVDAIDQSLAASVLWRLPLELALGVGALVLVLTIAALILTGAVAPGSPL